MNDLVAYYEWVRGDDLRVPVIEAGFAWIEANWPADEGETVISWGDSRIGNILYRDFEPVAVLDWEMAAVAPREVDIGWMIFIHDFFEHVAQQIELPGMPHFMRRDDVAATYEAASGVDAAEPRVLRALRGAAARDRDGTGHPAGDPLRRVGDARRPR